MILDVNRKQGMTLLHCIQGLPQLFGVQNHVELGGEQEVRGVALAIAAAMMFGRSKTIPRSVGSACCNSANSDPVAPPTSTAKRVVVVSIAMAASAAHSAVVLRIPAENSRA